MCSYLRSPTPEEHNKHLHTIFNHLREFGSIINPTKCVLIVPRFHFLTHLVDSQGIHPLEEKVTAVQDFAQLDTRCNLCKILQFLPLFHPKLCSDTYYSHSIIYPQLTLAKPLSGHNKPPKPLLNIKHALSTSHSTLSPISTGPNLYHDLCI